MGVFPRPRVTPHANAPSPVRKAQSGDFICLAGNGDSGSRQNPLGRFDLRPFCAPLLNSQLLTQGKVFKNDVMFAPEYEL